MYTMDIFEYNFLQSIIKIIFFFQFYLVRIFVLYLLYYIIKMYSFFDVRFNDCPIIYNINLIHSPLASLWIK